VHDILLLSVFLFFFLMLHHPPISTLFPYTTLFRSDFFARGSRARNLLRADVNGESSWRPRRILRSTRVWRGGPAHQERFRTFRRFRRASRRLEQPRRRGDCVAKRLSHCRDHRRLRFRRGGRSTTEAVRIAISSRSRTHAAWPGDPSEFSVSHLPLRDGLDNGLLH